MVAQLHYMVSYSMHYSTGRFPTLYFSLYGIRIEAKNELTCGWADPGHDKKCPT